MAGLWASLGDGGRDPRLACFASGGELDGALPSGRVLGLLECLALPGGPEDVPFAGATHDEAAGMLDAAAALEARAARLKLALVAEIIRRHAPALPGGGLPGPASWDISVLHEVAAVLRVSVQAAGPVAELAWQLAARLPGVAELLAAGVLTSLTVKIIIEEFAVLDGDKLAEAQKRLLDYDLGGDDMIPGKIRRLCQRIADTIDPDGAARRREQAQREQARVRFFRGHGGAGALFAGGLPPDEALKSEANVQKRALEYKNAGLAEKMDFLRVLALVDLTNGLPVPARVALWQAERATGQPGYDADSTRGENSGDGGAGDDRAGGSGAGDDGSQDAGSGDDGPGGGGGPGPGGGNGPHGGGPDADGPGGGPLPAGMPDPGLPALANMTYPLATVLGQANRPGEAAGYGSLDPALVRALANAAAARCGGRFAATRHALTAK
jgi:uncharacterized protein DUF222